MIKVNTKRVLALWAIVGVREGKNLKILHAYSFRDLSVHTDGQIKNIYTL